MEQRDLGAVRVVGNSSVLLTWEEQDMLESHYKDMGYSGYKPTY